MRTTLTLNPDVVRLLDEEVHRVRRPLMHSNDTDFGRFPQLRWVNPLA